MTPARISDIPNNKTIKHKSFILLLIALLIALAFIPSRAKGDTDTPKSVAIPTSEPSPIPYPASVEPQVTAQKPVGDRTKRIVVPLAEKQRIAALVARTFPDEPVMLMVLQGESQFDCGIKNPSSSARGCYQILKSTWSDRSCTGDILVAEDNIACARKIYDRYGLSPWLESKGTWGPYVNSSFGHILSVLKI